MLGFPTASSASAAGSVVDHVQVSMTNSRVLRFCCRHTLDTLAEPSAATNMMFVNHDAGNQWFLTRISDGHERVSVGEIRQFDSAALEPIPCDGRELEQQAADVLPLFQLFYRFKAVLLPLCAERFGIRPDDPDALRAFFRQASERNSSARPPA